MSASSLPTPAPSTEIAAKTLHLGTALDASFSLPPAALNATSTTPTKPSDVSSSVLSSRTNGGETSYAASKPRTESVKKRRISLVTQDHEYAIPPPPTRSRKIIQMKPKADATASTTSGKRLQPLIAPSPSPQSKSHIDTETSPSSTVNTSPTHTSRKSKTSNTTPSAPTTAASRKIARKTAHSLIERRRRSKMNEEFGVLKNMIPACVGQDMHKLAILQASIEYMRYLEKCLTDLKDASSSSHRKQEFSVSRSDSSSPSSEIGEMQDIHSLRQAAAVVASNSYSSSNSTASFSRMVSISPAIQPKSQQASTYTSPFQGPSTHPGWATQSASAVSSPSFEPVRDRFSSTSTSFKLTSPAIAAVQIPEDHEVTTALLMLNSDRRKWNQKQTPNGKNYVTKTQSSAGRGISVKDLLS